MIMNDAAIDVVIPTRDRPGQLIATLEALARQSRSDFGVIVVDDGSHFEVETACPPALRTSMRIRFVRNAVSLGAGSARNRGVENSRARYMIFIDDDCIATPDLVGKHYDVLSRMDSPVVSLGPILSVEGRRLPVWSHWDAYQLEREYAKLANGTAHAGWGHLFTGNVGLRRSDFLAVGGFDERFPRGEDTELGYRLAVQGCRFEFDSDAIVFHDSRRSLRSWLGIAAAAATSDVEMQEREPESDRLAMMTRQLRSRHPALRMTRRLFGGPIAARYAIWAALAIGLALHAARADQLSFYAMSVVRDLTYWRALQEGIAQRPNREDAMGVA